MSIPPRPPSPPEDSGDDFLPGTPVAPRDGADSTQALTQDELAELRRRAARRGPAAPLDGDDEATQMLSIEELRDLAAETRDPRLDEQRAAPSARRVTRDEARAAEAAADQQAAPSAWPLPVTGQVPVTRQGTARTQQPQSTAVAAPAARGAAPHFPAAPQPGTAGDPARPTGPRPPERRRSSRWWIWLLAVLALLVVAALVVLGAQAMARQEPSANPATIPPPPPVASEEETAQATPTPSAPEVEAFASPSGNITCTIDAERARCTIAEHDYDPPERPADCTWDGWGSTVVANADGAGFSCDETGPEAGTAETLAYGESVTANGMTCTSERSGIRCASDESGSGFALSRAAASVDP